MSIYQKLRVKIVLVETLAFLFVTVLIVGTINAVNYNQMVRSAHSYLTLLEQSHGVIPDVGMPHEGEEEEDVIRLGYGRSLTPETRFTTRFFITVINEKGQLVDYNLENTAAVSSQTVGNYATSAGLRHEKEAMVGSYRFLKSPDPVTGLTTIYFVDCTNTLAYNRYVFQMSVLIACVCMLLVFLLVYAFSDRAIRPMVENMQLQRQFITDAGHELKTPLAAISANADVLEMMVGKNEMIDKIKRQTMQMSELVNEMLTLSKMDGADMEPANLEDVDFTALVRNNTEDIRSRAEGEGKKLEVNLDEAIHVKGVRKDLTRMVSVLTDNAVKYCASEGTIRVRLSFSARTATLEVMNHSEPIPDEELPRLFERFYRTDASRSRDTGSYGIGLSIAKAAAENHKGRITVKNIPAYKADAPDRETERLSKAEYARRKEQSALDPKDYYVCFTVTLPASCRPEKEGKHES
ncbi:MAG: HAMP domain-containing histidine kinase [Lachnospiraceae bacterium]|nr:HAMP domain-containing histidine kinase [Lachnospiraceae bacterium]